MKSSKTILLSYLFFLSFCLSAQTTQEKVQLILNQQTNAYQFNKSDIEDWVITDEHISSTSGVHHIYVRQRYQGVEIFKANASFHFLVNGDLLKQSSHFITNIDEKIQVNATTISAKGAIEAIAKTMDYSLNELTLLTENVADGQQIWSDGGISRRDIPTKQIYVLNEQNQLVLSWDISIYEKDAANWWSFKVDAATGKILEQNNWVIHCTWDTPIDKKGTLTPSLPIDSACKQHFHKNSSSTPFPEKLPISSIPKNNLADNANYTIYPLGIISPDAGNRITVTNPANPNASPYGWHDINGITGPEYTITRGNNVWAKEDLADDDEGTIGFSPSGGNNLNFDYPLNFSSAPIDNQDAALTNLFYWCNVVHDVAYQYGFDEASGNFQANNYGKGGIGNDELLADGFDGSGFNNAYMSVPTDGSRPTMQMFLWNIVDFKVNSPATISNAYAVRAATFGATSYNLSGNLVLVADATGTPSEGCSGNYSNTAAINGNIAVIDRGNCEFGTKSLNAQNVGAIAVVICNNESGNISAGGGTNGGQVTIPVVTMSQENCAILKMNLNEGVNVSLSPDLKDSNFDNGIITHEYAHGITIRLIGGAGTNTCLNNDEQMGEGWSDWYSLMLTMQAGDIGSQSRGVGTYVANEPLDDVGIRPFPYSTDMTINPHTYADIPDLAVPHGVGAVWSAMLWEMTWNLIDNYGFDSDIYNGLGGNNIALNLVTEGLKLTSCAPGFVDARDGILVADTVLYNGKYSDEIWKAFAKRGLGVSANQGNSSNSSDGIAAFDLPIPFQDTCIGNDLIDINQNQLPDLCEPCLANTTNLSFTNQMIPQGIAQASNSIQTTGNVFVNSLDTVIMKATNSITLKAGFYTQSSAYFVAKIATCTINDFAPTTINTITPNMHTTAVTSLPLSIFPNPTNGLTTIQFKLNQPQTIQLKLFNLQGKCIQTLANNHFLSEGAHNYIVDLATSSEGIYFISLQGKNSISIKKIINKK